MLASASLALLLTGCPLTDHYQLQPEDSNGGATGGSSTALNAGDGSVTDAGEASSISGAPNLTEGGRGGASSGGGEIGGDSGCSPACPAGHACVAHSCARGWVEMAAPPKPLVARSKAASVAMGNAVFIWGGIDNAGAALDNGAIYDPTQDLWTFLPKDPGSPSARIMATAVWTGSGSNKVIVYGGTDASGDNVFKDGAVYNIAENSWMALPPPGPATKPRSAPYGYWDGTRAVFFGGLNAVPANVSGADRFDLSKWSSSTTSGDPGQLGFSAIAFDGTVMYLQGGVIGSTRQDKVYAYTSSTDTWASLSKSLSVRTGAFGAWDGTHFVVWGGQDDDGLRDDGQALSGMSWSDMTATSVLSARRIAFRRSGWAFQVKPGVVAMIGGQVSTSGTTSEALATDGASYSVSTGEWTAIPSWTSQETHEYGIGVWTGEEFVLWGGRDQNVSTLTGERWAP
ncbi:MAG TPA: hypothetical protein VGJ91_15610 [Polyangiaceae bacterium]